ncbi:hypothetical protein AYJ57_25410 (plasmid) [Salipiger sp. CCB-MM3]|nr:hypothetical protein AYJ57_25410 [Salipiger sp. CCB-MM3]
MIKRDAVTDSDNADLLLDGVTNLDFHEINGKTFLFTSAVNGDHGFSVFRVSDNGGLKNVHNYSVSSSDDYGRFVLTDIGKHTYLVANDDYYDQIHVYEVANDGSLTFVSATPNYVNGDYSDIRDIQSMEVAGVTYFVATAQDQDTLLVMSLNDDKEMEIIQTITSTENLDNTSGLTIKQMGNRVFLLATGLYSDKISTYEIGNSDDALIGTMKSDEIVGLNGDDDLLGRGGNDKIKGLNGDDVISGHKGKDHLLGGNGSDIISGGIQNDTVEGGAGADILVGGAGRDALSYASASSGVTVNLASESSSGSDAKGDFFIGFEDLIGSNRKDKLTGESGSNRIDGNGGADKISGLGGKDILNGGAGNDTVLGGNGNDRVNGGVGNDRLLGGDGHDSLVGGGGKDTLIGGADDDTLRGNGGADTFVFETKVGNDIISDFRVGNDLIDLSGNGEFASFAELKSSAVTVNGDTLVLLEGDNSITINGVNEASLTADSFLF